MKLSAKFDADLLLYLLSHFECDGHTVHRLTQQCLPPTLTYTVKSSLFTHAHSSPLSLAARLHRCPANHSHYIKNGWTFSRQTRSHSGTVVCTHVHSRLTSVHTAVLLLQEAPCPSLLPWFPRWSSRIQGLIPPYTLPLLPSLQALPH